MPKKLSSRTWVRPRVLTSWDPEIQKYCTRVHHFILWTEPGPPWNVIWSRSRKDSPVLSKKMRSRASSASYRTKETMDQNHVISGPVKLSGLSKPLLAEPGETFNRSCQQRYCHPSLLPYGIGNHGHSQHCMMHVCADLVKQCLEPQSLVLLDHLLNRETREGWPLLTVDNEINGDSRSTNEWGPSLVGSLGLSCR